MLIMQCSHGASQSGGKILMAIVPQALPAMLKSLHGDEARKILQILIIALDILYTTLHCFIQFRKLFMFHSML